MKILPLSTFTPTQIREFMLAGEPFVAARSESDYWAYARFFGTTCFCALDEGNEEKLVGVLIAFRDQSKLDEIYIQDILVNADYRQQGVTRALLQQLENAAQAFGCTRLWLTSEANNDAATVWKKLGFENHPADYIENGVHVTKDLKGVGKNRAVFGRHYPIRESSKNTSPL